MKSSTLEALHSSKTNEWYTPDQIVSAARHTMGSIDLDPASCTKANETVKADDFFTKEDDGLSEVWSGNVFLNPPYGRGNWKKKFVDKAIAEYKCDNVSQVIMVLTASMCDQWFQPLYEYQMAFPKRRVQFIPSDPHTKEGQTGSTVIVYLGHNSGMFNKYFSPFCNVVTKHVW